ncbi:MAG TPA: AraC family transcriptional regulator [Lachnospiraceae bacterium]|jgi:AraC-like DNA-binding protein|nr:AraC family transcriptional regulator [Lachnospiraceae bacterium]
MKEFHSCKAAIDACIEQKYFAIAHLYFEEKTMNIHIHDCYEIYYSISGGKQFLIDNKSYMIKPGDLFFINQYESHHLTQIEQGELDRIVLSIHPDFLKQLSTPNTAMDYCFQYRTPGFSHRISLDKDQQQRFMYYIHKLTSLSGYAEDVMERAIFTEFMVFLNKAFFSQIKVKEENVNIRYQYDEQVNEILEYINQNIASPITIDHLANQFYLSKSYICRIFKQATGTTINKYLTARRISIAKSLLSEGMYVNEVCEKCGFRDYSNFLKSFTKAVGVSPKKYALYNAR